MAEPGPDVGGITGWILDVVESLGALGLGVLNVVDTFFPPIPSEVFLPLGGYVAATGAMHPVAAWVGATAGSMVGAWLLFWAGRALGRPRINRALSTVPLLTEEDLRRGDEWFDRHGVPSVFLGRLVPGVRSVISLPAGSSDMGWARFSVLTAAGSGLWNAALIGAGWGLGRRWQLVERWSTWIDVALVTVAVVAVARFVWRRRDRIGGGRE